MVRPAFSSDLDRADCAITLIFTWFGETRPEPLRRRTSPTSKRTTPPSRGEAWRLREGAHRLGRRVALEPQARPARLFITFAGGRSLPPRADMARGRREGGGPGPRRGRGAPASVPDRIPLPS